MLALGTVRFMILADCQNLHLLGGVSDSSQRFVKEGKLEAFGRRMALLLAPFRAVNERRACQAPAAHIIICAT